MRTYKLRRPPAVDVRKTSGLTPQLIGVLGVPLWWGR
jgi:hypothetical protein